MKEEINHFLLFADIKRKSSILLFYMEHMEVLDMQIEAIGSVKRSTDDDFGTARQTDYSVNRETIASADVVSKVQTDTPASDSDSQKQDERDSKQGKDPSKKTIDSVMSEANQRLSKTRCEYAYDEPTKRVSIKVYDKETDELIREVPPEKSLEMLQRMWELAGIIVDEKR
jgi:flagellar protein FlaG